MKDLPWYLQLDAHFAAQQSTYEATGAKHSDVPLYTRAHLQCPSLKVPCVAHYKGFPVAVSARTASETEVKQLYAAW
jgi:hypothetical protein